MADVFDDEEKLADITRQLIDGADFFTRAIDANGEPDGGRYGAFVSLHAAMEFLMNAGADSSQLKPLNRLSQALGDLDRGTVDPILKPRLRRPRGGKPSDTSQRELLKAYAAACVESLLKAGFDKEESCRRVGERLETIGYEVVTRRDSTPAKTVKSWYENIDENRQKERFHFLIGERDRKEFDPEAFAEKLLHQLPGIIAIPPVKM